MKNLFFFVVFGFMVSCQPGKRAVKYFDANPAKGADWCAVNFPALPVDTTITYQSDSSQYHEAIVSLVGLVDSLLNNRDTVTIEGKEYILVKANVDSIRSALSKEIKSKLKPCVDKIEIRTITKIDNAALTDCSNKLASEHEKYIKAETERGVYKSQGKSRLWLMVLAFFLLGVSGYFNIKKLFK